MAAYIVKSFTMKDGTVIDCTGLKHIYINDKQNLVIETTEALGDTPNKGSINIEAMKNIQMKPGGKGDLRYYVDHTIDKTQAVIHIYDGSVIDPEDPIDTIDVPVSLKVNLSELELNNKDLIDKTTYEDLTADGIDIKVKCKSSWTPAKLKAKSIDIRCNERGGVALQPAGADSNNHINKLKGEHSLKVPVEHFDEYTVTPGGIVKYFSYPTDGTWFCLGQVLANQAIQVFGKKVAKSDHSEWNDGMAAITRKGEVIGYGVTDTKGQTGYMNSEWLIGYADSAETTEIINAGPKGDNATIIDDKYIFIKRASIDDVLEATADDMPVIKVTTSSGETKWTVSDTGTTPINTATTPIQTKEEALPGTITRGNKTFPVSETGEAVIDLLIYTVTSTNVTVKGTTASYAISDNKFTITPAYPAHFSDTGGDGIEWITSNPMHTSIYSKDYRLKMDAPVYAVSRGDVVLTESTGKIDYPTQKDDFKDIISTSHPDVKWIDIINAAAYLKDHGDIPNDGSFYTPTTTSK